MEKQKNTYTSDVVKSVPKEIEKNLPEKLKFLRVVSGLTTNEVGQALNKTSSTITMWEKGKAVPDLGTLFKLRELYDLSDINEFFDEELPLNLKSLTKTEQELIFLWRSSDLDVKKAVKTLLKKCNIKEK